ncbi:hypothetical protein GW17_00034830 [Ensete ventricosum]|nr:hypothetical protein GW17_00034830 [Ensete ventricosum]
MALAAHHLIRCPPLVTVAPALVSSKTLHCHTRGFFSPLHLTTSLIFFLLFRVYRRGRSGFPVFARSAAPPTNLRFLRSLCVALILIGPAERSFLCVLVSGFRGRWEPKADLAAPQTGTRFKKSTLEITKNDDKLRYKMDRIPFLEEQVRKIRENGKIMSMDIEKLMLSEENRFDFVNEVAAEANSYIEANRDEYGFKKAILHVLSNRMNEAGFERSEAYMEEDPFRPGPSYLKELDT